MELTAIRMNILLRVFLRNSKAPVIYEGTREIHTIMQADYVLGRRNDKPLAKMLPKWPFEE